MLSCYINRVAESKIQNAKIKVLFCNPKFNWASGPGRSGGMRRIIFVPTLHTELESPFWNVIEKMAPGEEFMGRLTQRVNSVWQMIGTGALRIDADFSRVRIYPEGMTDKAIRNWEDEIKELQKIRQSERYEQGKDEIIRRMLIPSKEEEQKLVEEFGEQISKRRQGRLVETLLLQGATLEVADSDELQSEAMMCFDEYNSLLIGTAESDDPNISEEEIRQFLNEVEPITKKGNEVSIKREKFVADKINKTLKEGEVGVLIFGMGHYEGIVGELDQDIKVELINPELAEVIKEVRGEIGFNLLESLKFAIKEWETGSLGSEFKG